MPFLCVKPSVLATSVVAIGLLGIASHARADTRVLVTIKPIHALVAQVMGLTGTPDLLVSGTASPHTFVMKPSDAKKLTTADIVFRVSEAIEPFTTKAAANLPKATTLVTLQQAPGVVLLPQRVGGPFDSHDHAHEAAGHHHDHTDNDHDHDINASDGHIWLDPANAKAMLDQIAMTLSARTPALADTYRLNADASKIRIDRLTADLTRDLAPVAGRPYVVFHDAYQYFEKRFDLRVVGSITVNPDVPPSGKRLSSLRARIKALDAKCVFGEPNFDAKVIAAVIEGSAARSGTLDPEGASIPAGPDLYDTLMRNLATGVIACLQPS